MAANSYRIYKRATNDLEHIVDWYHHLSPTLGTLFLKEIESTLTKILTNPESNKVVTGEVRRCLLKQFPYVIYFTIHNNEIVVLRVRGKRQKSLRRYI